MEKLWANISVFLLKKDKLIDYDVTHTQFCYSNKFIHLPGGIVASSAFSAHKNFYIANIYEQRITWMTQYYRVIHVILYTYIWGYEHIS